MALGHHSTRRWSAPEAGTGLFLCEVNLLLFGSVVHSSRPSPLLEHRVCLLSDCRSKCLASLCGSKHGNRILTRLHDPRLSLASCYPIVRFVCFVSSYSPRPRPDLLRSPPPPLTPRARLPRLPRTLSLRSAPVTSALVSFDPPHDF